MSGFSQFCQFHKRYCHVLCTCRLIQNGVAHKTDQNICFQVNIGQYYMTTVIFKSDWLIPDPMRLNKIIIQSRKMLLLSKNIIEMGSKQCKIVFYII